MADPNSGSHLPDTRASDLPSSLDAWPALAFSSSALASATCCFFASICKKKKRGAHSGCPCHTWASPRDQRPQPAGLTALKGLAEPGCRGTCLPRQGARAPALTGHSVAREQGESKRPQTYHLLQPDPALC